MKSAGFRDLFAEARKVQVKITGNPDHYYPKLLINKAKRASLYVFIPVVISIVTIIIFHDLNYQYSWQDMVLPVIAFSSLLIFLPISEHWEYKPWQGGPR